MNKVLVVLNSEVPEAKLGRALSTGEVKKLNKLGKTFTTRDIVVRVNQIDPDYGIIAYKTSYGFSFSGVYVSRY